MNDSPIGKVNLVTSAPVVSKTGIIYAFVLKVIRVFLDTHIEWSPGRIRPIDGL